MSDLKLFRVISNTVEEMKSTSVALEKSLQTLIEQHLEAFLGIRFLASEYTTGKVHSGRIDTLGIDENSCPVIIEYKRALNENVINQGFFYLDWLMDHKADFKLLVMEKFGKEQADNIEWNSPRLLCIAGDFTNYDEYAVKQIPRNIDLIRYRRYGEDFLLLELVHTASAQTIRDAVLGGQKTKHPEKKVGIQGDATGAHITSAGHIDVLNKADDHLRDLFERLKAFLLALGDDVQMKSLSSYIAFTRIKTIAYVGIKLRTETLQVGLRVTASNVALEPGFTSAERKTGHLELTIRNASDLERAQPFLIESYEAS